MNGHGVIVPALLPFKRYVMDWFGVSSNKPSDSLVGDTEAASDVDALKVRAVLGCERENLVVAHIGQSESPEITKAVEAVNQYESLREV